MASLTISAAPVLVTATVGGPEGAAKAAASAKALKDVLDKIFAPAILGVICDAWYGFFFPLFSFVSRGRGFSVCQVADRVLLLGGLGLSARWFIGIIVISLETA